MTSFVPLRRLIPTEPVAANVEKPRLIENVSPAPSTPVKGRIASVVVLVKSIEQTKRVPAKAGGTDIMASVAIIDCPGAEAEATITPTIPGAVIRRVVTGRSGTERSGCREALAAKIKTTFFIL